MKKDISMRQPPGLHRGFTLIELLMGVTVLSIVLAIGVPSFAEVMRANRLASQVNEYITSLNYARSEAYKRGLPVVVCVGNATLSDCDASGSWAAGWLVFVDVNDNGTFNSATETVLQKSNAPPGSFTYTTTPAAQRTVTFRPLSVSPSNFTLEIYKSGCSGLEKRSIQVVATGRIKMAKTSC
jgi:prepilin-type N-terminal cleavage/methylation domain-containing protein